jgi:small Trp-rich protein
MVVVGVLMLLAWWADFGPFGRLPWWALGLPFLMAVLWWHFADTSGWTQRRVMEKMERRKAERREKALEALGLTRRREKHVTRAIKTAARASSADPTQVESPPAEPPRRDPRL